MREPKQPRPPHRGRPERSTAQQNQHSGEAHDAEIFASGGEILSRELAAREQDSVPTAALPSSKSRFFGRTTREISLTDSAATEITASEHKTQTEQTEIGAADDSAQRQSKKIVQRVQQQFAAWKETWKEKTQQSTARFRQRKRSRAAKIAAGESAISLEARLTERKQERRRVIWRRVLVLLSVIAGLAVIAWLALAAPFARFDAGAAKISGANAPSIINHAKVKEIAQKYDGVPLLLLGQSDLQQELSKIPEVETAQLDISLVHGVEISLRPASPVFCLQRGDQCVALNRHGVQMNANPQDLENVPRLGEIPEGKQQEKVVDATIQLLAAIDPDVRAQIAQVNYSAAGQFSFKLKDGRAVNWGISGQNEVKAQILQVLLQEAEKRNFDVSLPEAPVAS